MTAARGPHTDLLRRLAGTDASFVSLERAEQLGLCAASKLPLTLKILVECALRRAADPFALDLTGLTERPRRGSLAFYPTRLLLQDFTGLPLMTDLTSLRDAVAARGGDPARVNPTVPIDFCCDHALIAVHGGRPDARTLNERIEVERNRERFAFLKWCEQAFKNVRLLPPGSGIMHQLNLEYLASVVRLEEGLASPDTLLGTDSHTPMVGGLGVLAWGVGGIEAQAAMLGHAVEVTAPRVVGLRLHGRLRAPATSTDAVLHVTELMRRHGVTGAFIEAFGDGLTHMPVETRATIANMAPEYGATSVLFPIDDATLDYLRLTGREPAAIARVAVYAKAQGLWGSPTADVYDDIVDLDLSSIEPSMAGPKRPEERQPLGRVPESFAAAFGSAAPNDVSRPIDGDVVIAAITSCTNTAHPAAMLTAGLVARNAVARGLTVKPWVKTSFAPGSRVVGEYLAATGLQRDLDTLGFQIIGFGCTTCNGNSGPLLDDAAARIAAGDLSVAAVLSGNRNFQGRIHPLVRAGYLAAPALVVAYAIAGSVRHDISREPLGADRAGRPVMLSDIWPSEADIAALVSTVSADQYRHVYRARELGHEHWASIARADGITYRWDPASTFISPSPIEPAPPQGAIPDGFDDMRALAIFGDGITTDHLSPNGEILAGAPAARYLAEHAVAPADFGNYAARRGNYEIAVRGMFANPHLVNEMVPGRRGNATAVLPEETSATLYDAGVAYGARGIATIIIAGKGYGSGSSRDWAAKGVRALGVRAVLAESFEKIHRANLIGVGVLPLRFPSDHDRKSLGLTGREQFRLHGLTHGLTVRGVITLDIVRPDGSQATIAPILDIETPGEIAILRAGGLLQVLLDDLAGDPASRAPD